MLPCNKCYVVIYIPLIDTTYVNLHNLMFYVEHSLVRKHLSLNVSLRVSSESDKPKST